MSAALVVMLMMDALRGQEITDSKALRDFLRRLFSRLESAGAATTRDPTFDPNDVLHAVPERRRRCRGLCS